MPPNIPHLTTVDAGAARGMWFAQGWAASPAAPGSVPWPSSELGKRCSNKALRFYIGILKISSFCK